MVTGRIAYSVDAGTIGEFINDGLRSIDTDDAGIASGQGKSIHFSGGYYDQHRKI
jgi:hypothetical protein